ncbi:uncharacterized protein ACA1_389550 [Acanthamoeba castellanii str. Neff]|uniref:Uncharacterized protein n=1 Tax=Acanthamoeba castellanii (strain ATCC 30010 / Neff) TaxID=1257118 RepID=L8GEE9_ACACF|nr:uncharacterized protein ACA1_389550 [Acanthamoeba castellanii str. Neff]ELR11234.1 hypothetical protein ACA1_389550 [Acanthamoeba castellanii str. Neff]
MSTILPPGFRAFESTKSPDVLKVALLLHLASKSRFTHAVVATSLVEGVVKPATTSDKVRACAIFAVAETTPRGDVKTMLLGLNGALDLGNDPAHRSLSGKADTTSPGLDPSTLCQMLYKEIRKQLTSTKLKQHLVALLMDHLGQVTTDHQAMCLLDTIVPGSFAEGTVRQEVERDCPDALGVLRRLADEPQFDHLWRWLEQQDSESWDTKGLPLTARADLQRFLDAPLPAHWFAGKWMPDLAGLDDEDWRITVPCGFVWPQVIRNLASRVGSVQEEATGQLALVAELGQPARRLAIKWVATRLLPFKRVINKASILEHFLITAVSSLTAYEYQVAGFHRKFACDGYGDVAMHIDEYLGLVRDDDEDESARIMALHLIAMYPDLWRVTMPHVEAVFHNSARERCNIALCTTALSTLSFIAPVPLDSWPAASIQEEEREHVWRHVMPLRDMAATALAEHQTNGAVDHSGDDLPEELRSLVARKADKAAYSHLQVSAIRLALPFCLCLTHLGSFSVRVALQATTLTPAVHPLTFTHLQAQKLSWGWVNGYQDASSPCCLPEPSVPQPYYQHHGGTLSGPGT